MARVGGASRLFGHPLGYPKGMGSHIIEEKISLGVDFSSRPAL